MLIKDPARAEPASFYRDMLAVLDRRASAVCDNAAMVSEFVQDFCADL